MNAPESIQAALTTDPASKRASAERIAHLHRLVPSLQKERSNTLEACGGDEAMASDLAPWVIGPQALLPQVLRIIERGKLDESGYRNILWVIDRHMPVAAYLDSQRGT